MDPGLSITHAENGRLVLRGVDTWIMAGGLQIATQGEPTVPREESKQHVDIGLSVCASRDSPRAAHSLKPAPVHPRAWTSEPHSHLSTVQEEQRQAVGPGGYVGRQSPPWVALLTIPPGKMQEEPKTMVSSAPGGRKWVQAHTWATVS